MNEIAKVLSQAIKEGRWVNISYRNKEGKVTFFWIAIKNIIPDKKEIVVDMFNMVKSKDLNCISTTLSFSGILTASIISFSSYTVPESLIDRINQDPDAYSWLGSEMNTTDVLSYYQQCSEMDNDPYQKTHCMVPGVDCNTLLNQQSFQLDDKQFAFAVKNILDKYKGADKSQSLYTLALSFLAIDKGRKTYIVGYYDVDLDIQKKTLVIDAEKRFNTSFLWSEANKEVEEKESSVTKEKVSLFGYISMDPSEFIKLYQDNPEKGFAILKDGLHSGEVIDTRPNLMILERKFQVNLEETYETIRQEQKEGNLTYPMKAFFGDISRSVYNHARNNPDLVIMDRNINVDQMRVLYDSLRFPLTYVKGPPGTGKTQTLLNVILSAFENKKTVLICSGNNKPVDGIIQRLSMKYKGEEVTFPFLRLGNNDEVDKALEVIYQRSISQHFYSNQEKPISQIQESHESEMKDLVSKLASYEEKQQTKEKIDTIKKFIKSPENSDPSLKEYLESTLKEEQQKYDSLPEVTNEMVLSLFTPVEEDEKFQGMLYFYSLSFIEKLKSPEYEELRYISYIVDKTERLKEFNEWTRSDSNLEKLLKVFPIIFTTNISASKLGSGRTKFDLVIMDEAGQCNVADALLPTERGRNLLLVGDESQLRPVVLLEKGLDDHIREKHHVDLSFSYSRNSILSSMKKRDNISKRIFLRYHYRCGRKIVSFANERFYGGQMSLKYLHEEGEMSLLNVDNENTGGPKNSNYTEACAVVDYVVKNKAYHTTILTPFVAQATLINEMLSEKGIDSVHCGTVHTMQGAEDDVIIFSPSISKTTSKRTLNWINEAPEIVNVGVTRARKKLIVAADRNAIAALDLRRETDLGQLIDYVEKNGNVSVPSNEEYSVSIGYSNNSQAEAELMKTITQFTSVYPDFTVKRNVLLKTVFPEEPDFAYSRQEFDEVLYHDGKPYVAIEVNGSEHSSDYKVQARDKKKRDLCEKRKLKLLVIDNKDVKDYETLVGVIQGWRKKAEEK